MKKTYIAPYNTVVRLSTEKMVCDSIEQKGTTPYSKGGGNGTPDVSSDNLGRETISVPDAWDEW